MTELGGLLLAMRIHLRSIRTADSHCELRRPDLTAVGWVPGIEPGTAGLGNPLRPSPTPVTNGRTHGSECCLSSSNRHRITLPTGHPHFHKKNSSNRESRRDLRFPARSAGRFADGALDYIEPRRRNALRNKRPRQRTARPSGGGGIRTHGTVAGTPAFRAGQFSHSCTPPGSRGTWNPIHSRATDNARDPYGTP